MAFSIKPGPTRLAAALYIAGFNRTTPAPPFTDDLGKHFANPSNLVVALATIGGESGGEVLATHTNFPGSAQMSTDWGVCQINDMYNELYFAGGGNAPNSNFTPGKWNWENWCDQAQAMYAIYKAAGDKFTPWNAYNGGGYKRVRWQNSTWADWAQYGVNNAFALNKAGQAFDEIASISEDPLVLPVN